MKKTIILFAFIYICVNIYAQNMPNLRAMTVWQNMERDLRTVAIDFIEARQRDTSINERQFTFNNSDLYVLFNYFPADNIYRAVIFLRLPYGEKYNFPYLDALELKAGALQTFETLYGRSHQNWLDSTTLEDAWICSSWYRRATFVQYGNGMEYITLEYYARNLN